MKIKYILLVLSIIIVAGCGNKKQNSETETKVTEIKSVTLTPEQLKNAGIVTSKAEKKSLSTIVKLNGVIDVPPHNLVSVSAPLGGFLKQTSLLPGQYVKKGETLAIMEDMQYITLQQDYLSTVVRLTMLKLELERQKELNKTKAGSDKILEQTEAEYNSQKIAKKALYEKLRLIGISPENLNENNMSRSIRIQSPISGYISTIKVNTGKYVQPTDILFEMVNPSDIHLNLKIYEKDLDKVYIGQKLTAWTNSNPSHKYGLTVGLIAKNIGEDHTIEVHCQFNQYDTKLIPGIYMQAEIELTSESAQSVPEDAIFHADNRDYVFVSGNTNEFMLTEVVKGITHKGYTAIKKPDNQEFTDENIVIKGGYSLWMKMKNESE